MSRLVSFAPLGDLADLLVAGGVRSATTNPEDVQVPGVLVEPDTIAFDFLGAYAHRARLLLVVPANGTSRALDALAELLNQVTTAIPDDGPVALAGDITFRGVTLPGSTTALPGLVVPVEIEADYLPPDD